MESTTNQTPGLQHYTKREWLSITELTGFARCPRKFFYSTGCALRTRDEKIALKYGESIHAAVPVALTTGSADEALAVFNSIWQPSGLEEFSDPKRCSQSAYEMLLQLCSDNARGGFPYSLVLPPKTFKVKENISPYEVPFAIDIGLPIPLVGRVDAFGQMNATREPWVIEYKTTSQLGSQFMSAFDMNCQAIGYTIAARTALKLPNVRGCVLHGLFVSAKNQSSACLPIEVTPHMTDLWLAWANELGKNILEREKAGVWTQWVSGCNQIGMFGLPGYNCEFLQLCRTGPDWTRLKDLYKVEPHIPFTVDEPTKETPCSPQMSP